MALGDIYRLHALWRSAASLLTMENAFVFRADDAGVNDPADLVAAFDSQARDDYRQVLSSNYEIQSYRVEALPSHFSIFEVAAGNQGGQKTGDMLPAYCAMVVSIKTATPGPRGRGRLFLGPTAESVNSAAGTVGFGVIAEIDTMMDSITGMAVPTADGAWTFGIWSESDQEFRAYNSHIARTIWGRQAGRLR